MIKKNKNKELDNSEQVVSVVLMDKFDTILINNREWLGVYSKYDDALNVLECRKKEIDLTTNLVYEVKQNDSTFYVLQGFDAYNKKKLIVTFTIFTYKIIK